MVGDSNDIIWVYDNGALGSEAEHQIGKKPMNVFSRGYHGSSACMHNDDEHDDKVAQHGGYTPANGLTKTCSLGLQRKFFILDIHVMRW